MAENINKTESNFEIVIDGRLVSKKQLVNAWRFYTRYSLVGGESSCPLCGCDLAENELFCCKVCAEILPLDEKCEEHNTDVCKECCQHCEEESAYWDSVNSEIDKRRGK